MNGTTSKTVGNVPWDDSEYGELLEVLALVIFWDVVLPFGGLRLTFSIFLLRY